MMTKPGRAAGCGFLLLCPHPANPPDLKDMMKRKKQKTITDWEAIRTRWEAGETDTSLSLEYGVSRAAIHKHRTKEQWVREVAPELRRKVTEKVAGVVADATPEERASAIDAEATRRAEVLKRHRAQWREVEKLRQQAITLAESATLLPDDNAEIVTQKADRAVAAFERAKFAKITAQTTSIIQTGERRAWGIEGIEDPLQGKVMVELD